MPKILVPRGLNSPSVLVSKFLQVMHMNKITSQHQKLLGGIFRKLTFLRKSLEDTRICSMKENSVRWPFQ